MLESSSEGGGAPEPGKSALERPGSEPQYYFVSYWVREDQWVPRESLITIHPLEWLVLEKRETMNHVRLASWQPIDRQTYLRYHGRLTSVDDEFSEPTQVRMLRVRSDRERP